MVNHYYGFCHCKRIKKPRSSPIAVGMTGINRIVRLTLVIDFDFTYMVFEFDFHLEAARPAVFDEPAAKDAGPASHLRIARAAGRDADRNLKQAIEAVGRIVDHHDHFDRLLMAE